MRRSLPRRSALALLVLALAGGAAARTGACASSALPPALGPAERARIEALPLGLRVGVEPDGFPVYSEHLARDLRRAGVFAEVAPIEAMSPPPDLVARVEERIHGSAVIPLFTALTLGIFPTIVSEEHGNVFSLRRAAPNGAAGVPVLVRFVYDGPSTLGWVACALNLLPGFTAGEPSAAKRYQERLALAVVDALAAGERPAGR